MIDGDWEPKMRKVMVPFSTGGARCIPTEWGYKPGFHALELMPKLPDGNARLELFTPDEFENLKGRMIATLRGRIAAILAPLFPPAARAHRI